MSEIKVDTVGPRVDNGTLTIGAAGDTVNIAGTAGTGFPAGTTINTNADNRVITGSGTANTLTGEATLTYDATTLSNIPTGTQSNIRLQNSTTGSNASDGFLIQETGNDTYIINYENAGMYFRTNNTDHMQITAGGAILIKQGIYAISDQNTGIQFDGSDKITVHTAGTERMKVSAGGTVTINNGEANSSSVSFIVKGQSNNCPMRVISGVNSGSSENIVEFKKQNGTEIGTINANLDANTVSYNTSSDYRLKENVDYTWDATTRLKQLKPARFNFIADETNTLFDGFIAHEVSSVIPEAISGEKDAMHLEVLYTADDELPDGKEIGDVKEATKINPQGIDQSKIVPLLVKTIQELEARITTLENA